MDTLLIICIFILLPVVSIYWIATISGWTVLAAQYGTTEKFTGAMRSYIPCKMGIVPCSMDLLLAVGLGSNGLYLRLRLPQWTGLHSLLIPWSDIAPIKAPRLFWPMFALSFVHVPMIVLYLPLSAAAAFEPYLSQPKSA